MATRPGQGQVRASRLSRCGPHVLYGRRPPCAADGRGELARSPTTGRLPDMTSARRLLATFLAVAAVGGAAVLPPRALAQNVRSSGCGSLGPLSEGPYDYRTDRNRVTFIEGNHFQPQVEALVGGVSGPIGAELHYMLLYVPNHPRVLLALVRYGEKMRWSPPPG